MSFGNGAFGIQDAAQTYFGINASELNWQQAALLAGMVQSILTVSIADQGDTRATVRIILDGLDRGWNPELVTLEVNQAQLLSVPAAVVTDRQRSGRVWPPVRCLTANSGLCGLSVVRSSFDSFVVKRSEGVIGLNDLIGIFFFAPSFSLRLSPVLQLVQNFTSVPAASYSSGS